MMCSECGQREARHYSKKQKKFRRDRDHDLCQRCYNSHREKLRAQKAQSKRRCYRIMLKSM